VEGKQRRIREKRRKLCQEKRSWSLKTWTRIICYHCLLNRKVYRSLRQSTTAWCTTHLFSACVSALSSPVVNNYRNYHVSDFWGEFDYLGTVHQNTDRRNRMGDWIPQNPSIAQIRQNITEYAILPNGSTFVKSRVPHIRSILLYGPKGVGKTMLAETIANELGAIFINLSPSILQAASLASGKTGPTKLMHIAFQVAKDPLYGPAVIYIDQCETILQGGKKKGKAGDGPDRFKKDLQVGKRLPTSPVCLVPCPVPSPSRPGSLGLVVVLSLSLSLSVAHLLSCHTSFDLCRRCSLSRRMQLLSGSKTE
jgi:hypothetical protein